MGQIRPGGISRGQGGRRLQRGVRLAKMAAPGRDQIPLRRFALRGRTKTRCRPGEGRDPSSLASMIAEGICPNAKTRVRVAAMSTIALTLGSRRSPGRLVEMCRAL